VDTFTNRAAQVLEPSGEDFVASGSIYTALRGLIDDLKLDAVSIRCFDLVVDRKATGCLALSRLADEGLVAGCEGDLPSAVAMLWVQERLGQTSWMANPARVNVEANVLTLAHCTVPCSMLDGFKLRSHFESRLGAAIEGRMIAGPVTLLRIGAKALDDMWLAEGEIVSTGCEETLCRTQVNVQLHDLRVTELLDHPLGNHLVLTPGHVASELLDIT
jgi:L-fucose isomerase-like protein